MQERYLSFERQANPIRPLTPRQTEVLRLVAEGLSTSKIAINLGMAFDTVNDIIRHPEKGISGRLGTTYRIEMVIKALNSGQLDPEEISGRFDFDKYAALTQREREIFIEISDPEKYYQSYKQIAYKMKIKTQNLKNISSDIFKKLGINRRIDAIIFEVLRPKDPSRIIESN